MSNNSKKNSKKTRSKRGKAPAFFREALSSGDNSGYTGVVVQHYVPNIKKTYRTERRTELVNYGTATSSASAVVSGGFSFRIADLVGALALQTAFDQYRIRGVEFMFKPLTQPSVPTTNPTSNSFLIAAVDLDSAGTSSLYSDLAQYDKRQRLLLSPGQAGVIAFSPCPIAEVDATSGAASAGVITPNTWIDFAVTDVRYYGLKWLITQQAVGSTAFVRWEMWAEVTYECRSQN
jgi:hypothetical protein